MVHLNGAKSAFWEGVGSDAVTDRAFLQSMFDYCVPSPTSGLLEAFYQPEQVLSTGLLFILTQSSLL